MSDQVMPDDVMKAALANVSPKAVGQVEKMFVEEVLAEAARRALRQFLRTLPDEALLKLMPPNGAKP